jgi:dipeptidyl aminopeptidase/acylaminoacyl peptidase
MSYGGATFSWSPDSLKIAYRATGQLETRGDCFIVTLQNGASLNVTRFPSGAPAATQQPPLWDPSSEFVYFVRGGAAWKAAIDRAGSSAMERIASFEVEELAIQSEGRVWSPVDRPILVALAQNRSSKESAFYTIDVNSGHATLSLKSAQCHNCVNAVYHVVGGSSGTVSYFSEDATHPPDLWLSAPEFQAPRQITRLNPQFDRYVMGAAELLHWRSDDGEQLQGALLLPAGYRQGQRYPLITWVYGGDSLSDHLDRFGLGQDGPFNLQLFATRGYAVLLPDAPQHGDTPMADLAKAVLPGINQVIDMGVADPDRIGVMGHSYGGYSTMALLVQSTRFKAAVVSGGFGDLIAGYGAMEANGGAFGISLMEQGQGRMGGTPWQFRDRYIENSPIFYLDKVQTPILIVQGTADTATLPFLADELFIDLRRLGKQVEYAQYLGEEHTPSTWSYADQIDVASRWIGWFDKYLGPTAEISSWLSGGMAEP